MNRADLLHTVLRDGGWHTRRDVFQRVGFMLTNNAASELRARGIDVEQRRHKGNYEYRISQNSVAGELDQSTPLDSTHSATGHFAEPTPPGSAGTPGRVQSDGPSLKYPVAAGATDGESAPPLPGQLSIDQRFAEFYA